MTTPDKSQDIPLAEVKTFGLSEITILLTLVGSALTALFGHDWGISAHIPQIAGYAVIVLPIALSLARAIKHHGVAGANAVVVAQQLAQQTLDAYHQGRHAAPSLPTSDVTAVPGPPPVVTVDPPAPSPLDSAPASSTL